MASQVFLIRLTMEWNGVPQRKSLVNTFTHKISAERKKVDHSQNIPQMNDIDNFLFEQHIDKIQNCRVRLIGRYRSQLAVSMAKVKFVIKSQIRNTTKSST